MAVIDEGREHTLKSGALSLFDSASWGSRAPLRRTRSRPPRRRSSGPCSTAGRPRCSTVASSCSGSCSRSASCPAATLPRPAPPTLGSAGHSIRSSAISRAGRWSSRRSSSWSSPPSPAGASVISLFSRPRRPAPPWRPRPRRGLLPAYGRCGRRRRHGHGQGADHHVDRRGRAPACSSRSGVLPRAPRHQLLVALVLTMSVFHAHGSRRVRRRVPCLPRSSTGDGTSPPTSTRRPRRRPLGLGWVGVHRSSRCAFLLFEVFTVGSPTSSSRQASSQDPNNSSTSSRCLGQAVWHGCGGKLSSCRCCSRRSRHSRPPSFR